MTMFFIWGFVALILGWVGFTHWRETTGRTRRIARYQMLRDRDQPAAPCAHPDPSIGPPASDRPDATSDAPSDATGASADSGSSDGGGGNSD